jgi:alkanesulfonate monooxygenase SsuD/methylene tetrahydromethanopterin reductase-like flavin-dependent oxidoreductase (luciferase family)
MLSGSLEVGLQLPEVEREVGWPEVCEIAATAEACGFASIWVGDHMLYRSDGRRERGPLDCWTLLAALAASTKRVKLGPLVAATAFHPPGLIARMAATIDEVSQGRFVLGLGAGWNRVEFEAFGIPFDLRTARFAEAFTIIRKLVAGERVTFQGSHHRLEDAVLLPPPARPIPLMVGSQGPRTLSATLPYVETWNTWHAWYGNTVEGFAALSATIEAEVRRSACVLVTVEGGAGERPSDPASPPVDASRLFAHLDALSHAGADEAILVLDPITAQSVATVAELLAAPRSG